MDSDPNSAAADESPSSIGSGISVDGDIEADVDLRIRGRTAPAGKLRKSVYIE